MNETELNSINAEKIREYFRHNFNEAFCSGLHGVKLRYIVQSKGVADNALIILGGRTEYHEKYHELLFDLRHCEMAIYSYDHRGQGGSQRLLTDPQKGHVADFFDYANDLHSFLEQIVRPLHKRIYVLAFSMGAAITTLFELNSPGYLSAAVFCSPMFAINSWPLSERLVYQVAKSACSLGREEIYVPGGRPYNRKSRYLLNPFTSSEARFLTNHRYQCDNPNIAIGSPTFGWLYQAMRSTQYIAEHCPAIKIPILLLQSGKDRIVRADSQRVFAERTKACQLKTIPGARHEMLQERDVLRNQVLNEIIRFLRRQFKI